MPDVNVTFQKLDDDIVPEQFNLVEYLSSAKVHRRKRQLSPVYMLIILDASGSIGSDNFNSMKEFSAILAKSACGQRVAVMSFSTNVYAQYCFDCSQTSYSQKDNMKSVIESIPYSNGLTASGDAIKCACDYVLKQGSQCGFPQNTAAGKPDVQVIFITDGKSNHGRDVCSAATTCWDTVSQYANLYISPYYITPTPDYEEIKCIREGYGDGGTGFKSFEEFKDMITKIKVETEEGRKCYS